MDIDLTETTGKPEALTVSGQSAKAYQIDDILGIECGLKQANRGEGRSIRLLLEELAKGSGISLE